MALRLKGGLPGYCQLSAAMWERGMRGGLRSDLLLPDSICVQNGTIKTEDLDGGTITASGAGGAMRLEGEVTTVCIASVMGNNLQVARQRWV